ncbi:MAG: serine/threonine protein kinase [Blastocatellia bacterium]|nr:serine/threonine protein kinase [Blastocatellia bacterium]
MKICPTCHTCYDDTARFCTLDGNSLAESLPGPRVLEARYQLTKCIGQGRLGDVYQATDLTTVQQVSVKVLPPNLFTTAAAESSFRAEVERLAKISSPHIAATLAFGLLPNAATYLVSEFVEGRTLREELKQDGLMDLTRVLEITRQAALGLSVAHGAGVLHLDLKPENVMVMADAQTQELRVKVVDFGLARLKDALGGAVATDSGSVIIRMPHYTSPEEGTGMPVDGRSDVYSLGIILYEMLTDHVPFRDKFPMKVLIMHATKTPEPPRSLNPKIPAEIEALVLKMLTKEPDGRPATMQAVADALSKLIPAHNPILFAAPVAPPVPAPAPAAPSLNLPLRLTIIDADDEGNKSRTIPGTVQDASPQGMRIQTGTVATGQLNIIKDHTVAFKNRLDIAVDLPGGTVKMDAFAVRYNRAPDGMNWTVFIYIKDMARADRRLYEQYLKTVG